MKVTLSKCPICGEEMVQGYVPIQTKCDICGNTATTNYYCKNGHYFCNHCRYDKIYHEIKKVCMSTKSKNPIEIADTFAGSSDMSLLGCKHYLLTALVIYTAYRNAGGKGRDFEKSLDDIRDLVMMAPTSMCRLGGSCGIPIALGIAFQAICVQTKDIEETTKIANMLSGNCMKKLNNPNEEGSRDCCMRAGYLCAVEATRFLINNYWVDMELPEVVKCRFYLGRKTEKV